MISSDVPPMNWLNSKLADINLLWNQRHNREVQCPDNSDARQNVVDVLGRALARANAWNEPTRALQIVRSFLRIEDDRRVEKRKEDDEEGKQRQVERLPRPSKAVITSSDSGALPCAANEAIVAGNSSSEEPKITGITPDVFSFSGRCEVSP